MATAFGPGRTGPNKAKLTNKKVVVYHLCAKDKDAYKDSPIFKDLFYLGMGKSHSEGKSWGETQHFWKNITKDPVGPETLGVRVNKILETLARWDSEADEEEYETMTYAALRNKAINSAYAKLAILIDLDVAIKKKKNGKKEKGKTV